MSRYSSREIFLMDKIPPDAWQIMTTTNDGVTEWGDILSLTEALAEFAECWQEVDSLTHIEIVPLWNDTWHDEII